MIKLRNLWLFTWLQCCGHECDIVSVIRCGLRCQLGLNYILGFRIVSMCRYYQGIGRKESMGQHVGTHSSLTRHHGRHALHHTPHYTATHHSTSQGHTTPHHTHHLSRHNITTMVIIVHVIIALNCWRNIFL